MTIQKADPGGEYYFSLGITAPNQWGSTSGGPSLVNNAPAGRATLYAISMVTNGSFTDWVLSSNFPTLIVGGAFYVPAIGAFNANTTPLAFFDAATTQCDVRINTSGNLQITRNGTVLGTSTNALVSGSGWHYFEFQATFATGTGGSAQVWVDNISWLSVSSVNTSNSGNAFANHARFGWSGGGGTPGYWKDMYCLDTGTGVNTSRLGDIQIGPLYPNSAGPKQDFSNTGGGSQTISVQDGIAHTGTWPDGDTTYISDSVSGHISDFNHQTLGAGTVYAVLHVSYIRSDAGAVNFQQYTNSSGTIHTGSSTPAGGSYNYFFDIMEQDPATSAQWLVSGVNAATNGCKIP